VATSVYLVRHAAYEHHAAPEGTEAACDGGLSALGRQQATALRDRLKKTSEIRAAALYCSTLPRAVQTAEIIAPALGLEPRASAELCEWESGNNLLGIEAFTLIFDALDPTARRQHRFAEGFETIAEFTTRVQRKLQQMVAEHDGGTIVLVVHGGVVEAAFAYFLGYGLGLFEGGYPAAGFTSITHWRRSRPHGEWVLELANDTHHLREQG
jgi:probable phosphoglycerate mutase